MVFMNAGKEWQDRRQILQSKFTKASIRDYRPAASAALHQLLRNILDDPDNFIKHTRM